MNTKAVADKIVQRLQDSLSNCKFESIKSVYVCGSYCRGDWLNHSSDLDIHTIYDPSNETDSETEKQELIALIESAKGNGKFFAHCPDGVEVGFNFTTHVPRSHEDACKPSPYAYFSTLMFDFKKHNKTLYGVDVNSLLPNSPNPKENSLEWLKFLHERAMNLQGSDHRLAFIAYKSILAAQLLFGEETINKYDILNLYQKYVPDFNTKWFGEVIIRNYLGSFYPERPPILFEAEDYKNFLGELLKIASMDTHH